MSDTDLLSAATLRRHLDVSDRTLRRWLATGRLPEPDIRIGSTMRWRWSTIRAWEAEHATAEAKG